jgi:hypothetical protein
MEALARNRRTIDLVCAACGYGIAQAMPPERCPMCQSEAGWIEGPWRPFSRRAATARPARRRMTEVQGVPKLPGLDSNR